jgi:hypothetical protein
LRLVVDVRVVPLDAQRDLPCSISFGAVNQLVSCQASNAG